MIETLAPVGATADILNSPNAVPKRGSMTLKSLLACGGFVLAKIRCSDFTRPVTSYEVIVCLGFEVWRFRATVFDAERAALGEAAAGRRIDRARRVAFDEIISL